MALIDRDDLKRELQLRDSSDITLLETICTSILSLFDHLTGRTMEEGTRTEYYDMEEYQDRIHLDNYPVNQTATFTVHEDTEWEWGDDTLIAATEYRVDYQKGIVHYNSFFTEGKQSVKVVYDAGYTSSNVRAGLKQVLTRQAVVWFKQAKKETWDVTSITTPAGGGGAVIERHEKNLLPEFKMMVEVEKR